MYVFLKEYLSNRHVHQIFTDWYERQNGFEGRSNLGVEIKAEIKWNSSANLDTVQYQTSIRLYPQIWSPPLSKLHLCPTDGNRKDNPHGDLHLLRVSTRQQVPKR